MHYVLTSGLLPIYIVIRLRNKHTLLVLDMVPLQQQSSHEIITLILKSSTFQLELPKQFSEQG